MSMAHVPILTLGTAVAVLFLVRADEPRYSVADGTELVRNYKSSTKLDSGPCVLSVNGKPIPTEEAPDLRLSVIDEQTLELTDAIETVAAGRPTKFVRSFGDLENDGSETLHIVGPDGKVVDKASERERRSPFADKAVRFTWDPKEESYAQAWVGEGADDKLLEKLTADVDWLGLLPGKAVEKGDSWKLEPKLFVNLRMPAGDLHWEEEGKEPDPVAESINAQYSENMAGEGKATWEGRREVDGKELGVISIAAELTTHGEGATASGEERAMEIDLEYEGEVLWDLAAGHIAAFTFDGKVRALMSIERKAPLPTGEGLVRQEFDLRGTSKHELKVASAK